MDAERIEVAVAIVNYGAADLTLAALPALLADLAPWPGARVVVVDNASPGGDAARISAALPALDPDGRVILAPSPVNGGFAAGNNLARRALADRGLRPRFLLLLNPDAEVRPGAVAALLEVFARRPRVGVVGARLENEDGAERPAAFNFPSAFGEFARTVGVGPIARLRPVTAPLASEPIRVDWVSGAAMMVRTELWDALGGMDEGYFLYFEEVDFQRAAARAGWEVWRAPAARIVHRAGSSTGVQGDRTIHARMPAYWFDSWGRYFARNHGRAYARAAAMARIAGMLCGEIVGRLRGRRGGRAPGFLRDFAATCLLGPLPPRADRRGA